MIKPHLCAYPVKILFIDDEIDLLESYCSLPIENHIEISSKPLKIIEQLNNYCHANKPLTFIKQTAFLESENELDFDTVKNFVEFNENHPPLIIITDYQMPEINGLDFFSAINDNRFVKVLLTGEYQPLDALEALNSDKIDYFIPKGTETTQKKILVAIRELQFRFFYKITEKIDSLINFNFMSDSEFHFIFNKCISDFEFNQYYILNRFGCYKFKKGLEAYILNIFTEAQLDELCEMHSYFPGKILDQVVNRKMIFRCDMLENENQDDYHQTLCHANKHGKYYYCLIRTQNE